MGIEDPYSLDNHSCFGSYEATNSQCFDCDHKSACRADTKLRNDPEVATSYRRAVRVPQSSTVQIPQPSTLQQISTPSSVQAVVHENFTPYSGETMAERFGKNLLLNCCQTLFSTFVSFCGTFEWLPSTRKRKIVTTDESDKDNVD